MSKPDDFMADFRRRAIKASGESRGNNHANPPLYAENKSK